MFLLSAIFNNIPYILATIMVFSLLVFVHELGHFGVAKLVGVRVYEFSIGFGKKLFSRRRGETLYSLRAFPLGGFVSMAGMEPEVDKREAVKLLEEDYEKQGKSYTQEELEANAEVETVRLFSKKPVWARIAVILAGPVMNFVLAAVIFAGIFMSQGIPQPQTTIDKVLNEQPAAEAGLKPGDKITVINGKTVASWEEITAIIGKNYKKPLQITVERENKAQNFTVIPRKHSQENRYVIGIYPKFTILKPGPFAAIGYGTKLTFNVTIEVLQYIFKMIKGDVPVDIGGPVRITVEIGKAAKAGFLELFSRVGFFSLQLALFNLLPIPALDGSRILFLLWEGVWGRPVNQNRENFIHLVGFALLLLFVVVVTYHDITSTMTYQKIIDFIQHFFG